VGINALFTQAIRTQFGVKPHLFFEFFHHSIAPVKEKESSPKLVYAHAPAS
jgi:hypothetical protein